MLVPLKSDAIVLVVVQATEAFAGTLNNANSKIVGMITSEIWYRVSKLGTFRNASLRPLKGLLIVPYITYDDDVRVPHSMNNHSTRQPGI